MNFGNFARTTGLLGMVAAAAVLSACGGGGDGSGGGGGGGDAKQVSNGTTDPYVGSFLSACIQESPTTSFRIKRTVVKKSRTEADVTESYVDYSGTSCAGTGTPVSGNGGAVTINGTKVIDGKTVDKVTIVEPSFTGKDIIYTDGSSLFFGEDSGTVDAEGYPVNLDTSGDDTFTRI